METKFTEHDSLLLINKMIGQAQNNLQKGSANSIIFWGYLVTATAILNYVLMYVLSNPLQSCWVWCLMIPGLIIDRFIDKKLEREALVRTHIDSIMHSIWIGYEIAVAVFVIAIVGIVIGAKDTRYLIMITPVIMSMVGMAEFVTAKVCRFKPFLYGAFIFWIGAVICMVISLLSQTSNEQFLVLAICCICGFVVPGYQLNKKAKENV